MHFKLQCPHVLSTKIEFNELRLFLGSSDSLNGLSGFSDGLNAIVEEDITPDVWESARNWMMDRWELYNNCDTQVMLAAMLTYHICGDQGLSAMSAVGQLWLCSCGLTLLFSAVVGLLTWGHPPSEFCSGRELMHIYGAPKLISAFDDIQSPLSKQAVYWKLESGMHLAPDETSSSSGTESSWRFKDDDSTMSTERPRRNAYTSHHIKSKAARLKYTPDSDRNSSGSSSSSRSTSRLS